MSGSAKSEANFGRKTDDFTGNQQTQQQGTTDVKPTFDPRADALIASLSQSVADTGGGNDSASDFLKQTIASPGGVNPYAQQVVNSENKLADADFQKRLSGVRSSGYGGGIGRDLIDQGMFTSDFTDRQHASNAKTLLDAFKDNQGAQLSAAGQLSGIDATKLASALNLVNALRGQSGNTTQDSNTDTVSRDVTKTQQYNNSLSANFGKI